MKYVNGICTMILLPIALGFSGCAGTPEQESAVESQAPASSETVATATPTPGVAPGTPGASAAPTLPPVSPQAQRQFRQALDAMSAGNLEQAESLLQSMVGQFPDLAGPLTNLGILYANQGQDDQAMAYLQRAVGVNPKQYGAYHQMGILYRKQGRFQDALNAYQKALEINPEYALAHRNIGILYDLYLMQPQMALQHFQRYQELNGEQDKLVKKWIIDVKRRSGA